MAADRNELSPGGACACASSDSWRCAKAQGLLSLACRCDCHGYVHRQAAALAAAHAPEREPVMAADRARRYDRARARGRVDFETWFVAQFGAEPHAGRSLAELAAESAAAQHAALRAEASLHDRHRWIDRRAAALKAWAAQSAHAKEARRGR